MYKASDAWDLQLFLNRSATAVVAFLTNVTIFFADFVVDEAMDNREGNEQDKTPLGAMLNADLKIYSSSEYLLYTGQIKLCEQLKL